MKILSHTLPVSPDIRISCRTENRRAFNNMVAFILCAEMLLLITALIVFFENVFSR
jgi:hypothetical protein